MLTRKQKLDRIWQRTPAHRQAVMEGLRIILEQKDRETVPVFLGDLTDDQIDEQLGATTC